MYSSSRTKLRDSATLRFFMKVVCDMPDRYAVYFENSPRYVGVSMHSIGSVSYEPAGPGASDA